MHIVGSMETFVDCYGDQHRGFLDIFQVGTSKIFVVPAPQPVRRLSAWDLGLFFRRVPCSRPASVLA